MQPRSYAGMPGPRFSSMTSQRHPGLCFTKDAAVYDESLLLAGNMERYLLASHVGHIFRLMDPEKEETK
eukprot:4765459-Heterocapsa_arctica.AAC.1